MGRTSKQPARPSLGKPAVDVESALPAVYRALEDRRALKLADLGRLGVPPAERHQALARLASMGAEVTKNGARWPLRRQVLELVEQRTTVPLGSLGKLVAGASGKEAKSMAEALAREGVVYWLVRGKTEVLAARSVRVFQGAALGALGRAAKSVAQQAEKALRSRTVPKSVLRDDVREAWWEHIVEPPQKRAEAAPPALVAPPGAADLRERLRTAVKLALRPELGLAYVPELVGLLAPADSVQRIHAALLEAAQGGTLELRPESGLHRLSDEDLALCPEGPDATRLSWARLLDEDRP